jgi:hypothetical protein
MTFEEFLPEYLAAHSKPATRITHAAGTVAGVALLAYALAARKPKLLPVALMAGYLPAWCSHWFVEHNTPKTFGRPIYSLRGDFVMLRKTLSGDLTFGGRA